MNNSNFTDNLRNWSYPSDLANLSYLHQGDFLMNSYNEKKTQPCDENLELAFWVLNLCIGMIILAGNSFAIVVFVVSGQLYKNHMNVFLLSLAISDILLALVVVPSYAAYCTGCKHSLSSLCWFFEGGKDYTFLASVFNLLAISYDRHTAVFHPLLYNLYMTEKKVIAILTSVWLLPGILAGVRNTWQHTFNAEKTARINDTYTYVLLLCFVILPILAVCIINLRIINTIKLQIRKIQATNKTNEVDKDTMRRKKGTFSCVLIVVVFVICWLPRGLYFILKLTNRLGSVEPLLPKLSVTFLLFQSSLNPVIYSFFRSEFRQSASRLVRCIYHKLFY